MEEEEKEEKEEEEADRGVHQFQQIEANMSILSHMSAIQGSDMLQTTFRTHSAKLE